jgi:hypothetical protein
MFHGYMLKDMQQIAHDNTISYAAPRSLLGEINKNTGKNKIPEKEELELGINSTLELYREIEILEGHSGHLIGP